MSYVRGSDRQRANAVRDTIYHAPIRCPRCDAVKPITDGVDRPVRYHTCKCCGLRFRSVELDQETFARIIEAADDSRSPFPNDSDRSGE